MGKRQRKANRRRLQQPPSPAAEGASAPRRREEWVGGGRGMDVLIDDDDIECIEESAATLTEVRSDLAPIGEATNVRSDGTIPLRLISPGWGSSGYYSAAVLEAAGGDNVFPAGTQMFWDHPRTSDALERPERSLRDLAAVLETNGVWQANHPDGPGIYAQARVFAPYQPVVTEMAPHIGVSIRASAEISNGEADGRRGRIVERIVEGHSVDFVTKPGRGGQVLAILESARTTSEAWADDVRQALRTELEQRFPPGDGEYLWVRDHSETTVVFHREGDNAGTYELGYTLDADGNVTLADGDPIEVRVTTTYTPIGEARNVGQWIESHLHRAFTCMCDDMAAEGRLTREERIALSSAIGDALGVFVGAVEQAAPQLYQRDLYEEPPANTPVTESLEDSMTPEEIREAVATAVQAEVAPLREAVDTLTTERDELRTTNARLTEANLVRDARDVVTSQVNAVEGLPGPTRARLISSLQLNPPVTEAGALDVDALATRVTESIAAEVAYLAEATGSPVRGVGGGGTGEPATAEEATADLEQVFVDLGLSESAAKVAVAGRGA